MSSASTFRGRMDTAFKMFRSAVTRAPPPVSPMTPCRGQVFFGTEAKAAGLVDGVGDLNYAFGLLRRTIRSRGA